jgi:type II secretory pathway pseudopilin PulG
LAAIAVPNFLEAQTRAKVSRARADLRSAATALEAYRIDFNHYPLTRGQFSFTTMVQEQEPVHWQVSSGPSAGQSRTRAFCTLSLRLSTPISYITSTAFTDPFKRGGVDPSGLSPASLGNYDTGDPTDQALAYHNIFQFAIQNGANGTYPADDYNEDYGAWRIFSLGPNMAYETVSGNPMTGSFFGQSDFGWLYDPTNGTVSSGYIIRTQKDTQGEHLAKPD